MRQKSPLVLAACLAGILAAAPAGSGAMAQTVGSNPPPRIVVTPPLVAPAAVDQPSADLVAPTGGWANAGQHQFGPSYEMYVPVEIKSNIPDVERSWVASGAPLNGNGQTPAGQACVADADCAAPLGCFNRADSGQIPVKECALPPER